MNLLVYPLYLINNNKEHYDTHKEIVELNISYFAAQQGFIPPLRIQYMKTVNA